VRRFALLLATLALWFAPTEPALAADDGQAAYARACADCHRNAARLVARYSQMYPEDRRTALEDLLKTHHAPDPAERARIIAWLETQLPRR